ncbi:hypothetical protein IM660_15765 [Ruania alkalisoli]|uniref:ABC transporter domain-containing protein n=1 Tax=Ruania alkalisoli TaxID=2779775 RepID=A0A7M1SR86_9MICO|nr:ATP-binding cassette domain-containing protein [Ruania alkalisoli]QOR70070.1 hypothetical protein IM660_15765 [Ruania alkalisoli]
MTTRAHTGVRGIDLTARAGELIVITGGVGAGPTTLLRAIQGTLRVPPAA